MVFGRSSSQQHRAGASANVSGYNTPSRTSLTQQQQQLQSTNGEKDSTKERRGSFSFLRRAKSSDNYAKQAEPTSGSNRRLRRRRTLEKEQAEKQKAELQASQKPPSLPLPQILTSPPSNSGLQQLQQSYPPSSYGSQRVASAGYVPVPYRQRYQNNMSSTSSIQAAATQAAADNDENSSPPPDAVPKTKATEPHSRTESMTNRGRYSYASSAMSNINSPRRVRRRKDPTPFNILVIGSKNCGKTSFIESLRKSLADPVKTRPSTGSPPTVDPVSEYGSFTSHYLETELDGERVGVTLYDSKGLEKHLADLQLREMASFLESKFTETFQEEQKVLRATGVRDSHIHCVLLILDPSRLDANLSSLATKTQQKVDGSYETKPRLIGILEEALDVDVIRVLEGKTTVIPIISKADTITTAHMSYLKRSVWDSLKKIKFDPLEALNLEASDSESEYDTPEQSLLQEADDIYTSKTGGHRRGSSNDEYHNAATKLEPSLGASLDPAKPPQHADIRISHMSDSVELPYLPLSIISPDVYEPGSKGRRFPWGFADPANPEHCDFVKLKESVFGEWRSELRQASRERWYEGWRTSRLKRRGQTSISPSVPNATTRAVSGAAAYGSPPSREMNGYSASRVSQIGIAISEKPEQEGVY